MTTGALLFAYNNEQIDYIRMAAWTAKNIRRHLGIPVALVSDQKTDYFFEQQIYCPSPGTNGRYFSDYKTTSTWHNNTRVNAYELSPWSTTLVIDVDYVVASNQLKTILNSGQDFLAHQTAYDISNTENFDEYNYFGLHNMASWWATVMVFQKSNRAKLIFETMEMIKDNWDHYRNLYKIRQHTYRNDFSLAIALSIVNGHTFSQPSIPWSLASLTMNHNVKQLGPDHYRVDFLTPDQKPRWIELKNQDFHAMGKKALGEIVANSC